MSLNHLVMVKRLPDPEDPGFKPKKSHPVIGNSLCQPSSKWVPVSNQGRIRKQKEKDGLCLSYTEPKIQWVFKPQKTFTCLFTLAEEITKNKPFVQLTA